MEESAQKALEESERETALKTESDFQSDLAREKLQKRPSNNIMSREMVDGVLAAQAKTEMSNPLSDFNSNDYTLRGSAKESRVYDSRSGLKETPRDSGSSNRNIRTLVSEARKRMAKQADISNQEKLSFEDRTPQKSKGTIKSYEPVSPVNLKSLGFMERVVRRKTSSERSKSPLLPNDRYRPATPLKERNRQTPSPYKTESLREMRVHKEENLRLKFQK